MTREEAVEVILQGDRVRVCPECDGNGVRNYADPPSHSLTALRLMACRRCNTSGQVYRRRWAEACKVLGKPLPELSWHYDDEKVVPGLKPRQHRKVPFDPGRIED